MQKMDPQELEVSQLHEALGIIQIFTEQRRVLAQDTSNFNTSNYTLNSWPDQYSPQQPPQQQKIVPNHHSHPQLQFSSASAAPPSHQLPVFLTQLKSESNDTVGYHSSPFQNVPSSPSSLPPSTGGLLSLLEDDSGEKGNKRKCPDSRIPIGTGPYFLGDVKLHHKLVQQQQQQQQQQQPQQHTITGLNPFNPEANRSLVSGNLNGDEMNQSALSAFTGSAPSFEPPMPEPLPISTPVPMRIQSEPQKGFCLDQFALLHALGIYLT